jgi:excisionase family DNA binding protein
MPLRFLVAYEIEEAMREKDVFTVGEVAKICGLSVSTVVKWFDSGRFKGYRMPDRGDRRIFREDLMRFIKENGIPLRDCGGSVKYRVLLVAVDATFDRLLRESLSRIEDYRFEVALSVFEFGALVFSLQPDAIVLDFSLGRRESIEIVSSLRKDDAYADTLIIGLASEDEAEPEQLLQYGFNVVFKKPLDIAIIAKRIEIEKEAYR